MNFVLSKVMLSGCVVNITFINIHKASLGQDHGRSPCYNISYFLKVNS